MQFSHCRYPDYVFYGDEKITASAKVGSRYSKESLIGLLVDIYSIAESDYIVCTMSSQVEFLQKIRCKVKLKE